jgi:hypothetical protein
VPAADRSNVILISEKDKWGTGYKNFNWGTITSGDYSQTYYAAFEGRYYKAIFKDNLNANYNEIIEVQYDPEGKNKFHTNVKEPMPIKETGTEYRYTLKGWTTTELHGGYYDSGVKIEEYLTDVSTLPVIDNVVLYAVF